MAAPLRLLDLPDVLFPLISANLGLPDE